MVSLVENFLTSLVGVGNDYQNVTKTATTLTNVRKVNLEKLKTYQTINNLIAVTFQIEFLKQIFASIKKMFFLNFCQCSRL